MNTITDVKNLGLYAKYKVIRTDGTSSPGAKHENDEYFVLNLSTDQHAIPAINAYAKSCAETHPALSADLRMFVNSKIQSNDEFITVPETTLPSGIVIAAFQVGKYACSKSDLGTAIVTASRKPWSNINFHNAKKTCAEVGYSLITELQYLAIAYQITQQDINWTSGKVGEGEVYRGLHKGNVDEAQDGHYESTDTAERRWHALSNGERVYDFSGNIYSWVFDDVQGDENGVVARDFAKDSPSITTAPYPSREKGMGDYKVWDWSGIALVRGGYWGSGGSAGAFCLGDAWPGVDSDRVGFRCTKSL